MNSINDKNNKKLNNNINHKITKFINILNNIKNNKLDKNLILYLNKMIDNFFLKFDEQLYKINFNNSYLNNDNLDIYKNNIFYKNNNYLFDNDENLDNYNFLDNENELNIHNNIDFDIKNQYITLPVAGEQVSLSVGGEEGSLSVLEEEFSLPTIIKNYDDFYESYILKNDYNNNNLNNIIFKYDDDINVTNYSIEILNFFKMCDDENKKNIKKSLFPVKYL